MTDQEDQAQEDNPKRSSHGGTAPVKFNDNVTVFPDQPIPSLTRGPVKVYKAAGKGRIPENLCIYICHPKYTQRSLKASNYATLINPGLPNLVASGVIDWPVDNQQYYGLIYEYTPSFRLTQDPRDSITLGWKTDIAMNIFVKPLFSALCDMVNKDIFHGAIHPGNLIAHGTSGKTERLSLGECLSLPAGYDMPILYETIERSLASPIGRGPGVATDDLYSFGATLACLLRTNDPMEGKTDKEIIQHKISNGSFGTFIAKDRFTGSILELLRGLLYDDPGQRWTIEDIESWMDGRRLNKKPAGKKIKASRPLEFGEEKLILPELIAWEGAENPQILSEIIENDTMNQWLKRAVDDKDIKERYEKACISATEGGSSFADHIATHISIALHPNAPLRYKGVYSFPDGFGKALTSAVINKDDLQPYVEFIQHSFVMRWLDTYTGSGVDAGTVMTKYNTSRKYLGQKLIGLGLERCVYYLNPETHCLSDKLQGFYVRNAEDMISAFEAISHTPNRPIRFFDRHSVAFLSAKDSRVVDQFVHDLKMKDPGILTLAELKVLSAIQSKFKMGKFPGIAKWVVSNMEPVLEKLHDREKRVWLKDKIEKEKQAGNLTKMLDLFENERIFDRDFREYKSMMTLYKQLDQEKRILKSKTKDERNFARGTARIASAIVSCVIAALVILFAVVTDL